MKTRGFGELLFPELVKAGNAKRRSVNFTIGCHHRCLYCWACKLSLERLHTVDSVEQWPNQIIDQERVNRNWGKFNGTTQFPTMHDIPRQRRDVIDAGKKVLENLLEDGNKVWWTSKLHWWVGRYILLHSRTIRNHADNLITCVDITTIDDKKRAYWEPNASEIGDRLQALHEAGDEGYRVAAIVEPVLDPPKQAIELINRLLGQVTEHVILGPPNYTDYIGRVTNVSEEFRELQRITNSDNLKMIHDEFGNDKRVQFKDTFIKLMGNDSK